MCDVQEWLVYSLPQKKVPKMNERTMMCAIHLNQHARMCCHYQVKRAC